VAAGRTDVKTDRIVRAEVAASSRPVRRYIMCVDDEQAVLNQLIHQLTRRFGKTHRIEGAESAEEALRLIEEFSRDNGRVEIVIADQIMPGMRGDHFLEIINKKHPEMIRIMLTGQAGLDSATYAINNAGLHKYIEKPWDIEDLSLTIQNLLVQYSLNLELKDYHRELERKNTSLRSLQSLGLKLATIPEIEHVPPAIVECARTIAADCHFALFVSGTALRTNVDSWTYSPKFQLDEETQGLIRERVLKEEAAETARMPFFQMSLTLPAGTIEGVEALVVPAVILSVRTKERLYGALACVCASQHEMTTSDLEILNILTNQTSIALENKLLLSQRILSEKLAAIGQMVSTITHDYRTPMTVVKGYAEMLECEELPTPEVHKFGMLINREVDRLEHMIEQLLDFVRGAKGEVRLASCTLQEAIEEVRIAFAPQFKAAGVVMETSFPESGAVHADVEKLKRVFINLTKNALEAMPGGGTLRVELTQEGSYYRLTFSDTGTGISNDMLPRIFQPFCSKGKSKGLGLGTSIARSIIQEHGGAISVSSEPGVGTTFTMTVPRAPAAT